MDHKDGTGNKDQEHDGIKNGIHWGQGYVRKSTSGHITFNCS